MRELSISPWQPCVLEKQFWAPDAFSLMDVGGNVIAALDDVQWQSFCDVKEVTRVCTTPRSQGGGQGDIR